MENLKIKKRQIFFNLLSFFIFLFLIFNQALAQTTLPLVVYPARQFLEVNPGEKTGVVVNFVNQSNQPLSGFIRIVDFIVRDNQGTPELIENTESAPEKYAASSWFKSEYDKLTLPANEKVTIQAQINVPQNANPGGKYVAIYFQTQAPAFAQDTATNYEAGTGITPRLASLIYIKVKGDIKENAFVTRFQAPNFLEYGPINVETEILNRGDYHITPKGEITLTDFTGKVIDKSILKETNIFPDTVRTFTNTLGKKWLVGKYRLELAATYGEKGKTLTAFTEVWVFPWKLATIVVLSLIIVILLARHFYQTTLLKEKTLEEELEKEKEEIERLKQELKNRPE
jgi:ribosomal protein S4